MCIVESVFSFKFRTLKLLNLSEVTGCSCDSMEKSIISNSFPPDEKTELISDSAHTTRLSVSSQVHTSLMHFHPSLMHFPLKITRGWRTLMVFTAFLQQDEVAAYIHPQPKSIRQTRWYLDAFIWRKRPFWAIEWNCFIAAYELVLRAWLKTLQWCEVRYEKRGWIRSKQSTLIAIQWYFSSGKD